ncbi:Cof-type HAD-IIB family hydrolase [Crocosphaera sp. UHCC 0190]|uniref:Cof-type HAD-IIB family hydrolase n=1 Tax=Crocosphaera sp. UHCC 0190 TaxID=3110246 RepID=UPI002B210622|nr:Cof-type HAD-IIB family hydrolase [Crocosphaera sp. UHCC 0190]MEA5511420.1 Cof-type HAD-IIB family hydrolase [Crocosphaera sp. UHCC 0190]
MTIRLLVLDIDGTIAGKSNTVSQSVKDAIKLAQTQGIQVALATGRMYYSALRFHGLIASELPIIAYNGAWIQCPLTGIRHHHFPVSPDIALQLLDYFEQPHWLKKLEVHCYIDDRLYVREFTARTEVYRKRSGIEPIVVEDLRSIVALETTKVLAIGKSQLMGKLLSDLRQRYSRDQLYVTQSTPIYFEATHPNANKGFGVKFLAEELLQLTSDQVMAIGDNFNDLEMLQYVGLGIAMGDAPKEVKQVAKWVAPDVEFDGVAKAIHKFLLS